MGARLATVQRFDGKRASVGAVVVISCLRHDDKPGTCLRAGMVVAVSSTMDLPWILDLKHSANEPTRELRFWPASSQGEIEAMPADHWTWPLETAGNWR